MLGPFALFVPCTNVLVTAQSTLAPFFDLIPHIFSCVILDQMLLSISKTACTGEPWIRNMKQFASTKMYIGQYHDQP